MDDTKAKEIDDILGMIGHVKKTTTEDVDGVDALREELERLRRENESLKSQKHKAFRLQVSQKGAISAYGLGRFPVTLYREQWLTLLEHAQGIREFIREHESVLSVKKKQ